MLGLLLNEHSLRGIFLVSAAVDDGSCRNLSCGIVKAQLFVPS